jgi:hypothetical protein
LFLPSSYIPESGSLAAQWITHTVLDNFWHEYAMNSLEVAQAD